MTVTMTIEEFDEFRSEQQTLIEVRKFLRKRVHYQPGALEASHSLADGFVEYAKDLPAEDVSLLLAIVGVRFNRSNVDSEE